MFHVDLKHLVNFYLALSIEQYFSYIYDDN